VRQLAGASDEKSIENNLQTKAKNNLFFVDSFVREITRLFVEEGKRMNLINDVVMPFVRVTVDTFDAMMDIKMDVETCEYTEGRFRTGGVYSMINFTGTLSGTVAVSMESETAFSAFELFLGEPVKEMDDQAADAAGEVINIIAGAKSYVNNQTMNMSLPSVMYGDPMLIAMPKDVPVVKTVFSNPNIGKVILFVALKETR